MNGNEIDLNTIYQIISTWTSEGKVFVQRCGTNFRVFIIRGELMFEFDREWVRARRDKLLEISRLGYLVTEAHGHHVCSYDQ